MISASSCRYLPYIGQTYSISYLLFLNYLVPSVTYFVTYIIHCYSAQSMIANEMTDATFIEDCVMVQLNEDHAS